MATPTLLASGRMEPRKIVGSVDTSEFLVALAASAGFLLSLGSEGIGWNVVVALMAGGLVAAPFAAWLVQKVTARLLGACVGGLIVLTNVRTLFDVRGVDGSTRWLVYTVLVAVWIFAVAWVVQAHRRTGQPIFNSSAPNRATMPATESSS